MAAAGRKPCSVSLSWGVGLLFFFPVFWMVLNGFKDEADANSDPKLFFDPTFDRFREVTGETTGLLVVQRGVRQLVLDRAHLDDHGHVARDPGRLRSGRPSDEEVAGHLVLLHLHEVPTDRGAIMPLWIIARDLDLLGTRTVLVILYTAMNLPLAVWMLRSFFAEVPKELIEASQIDGCSLLGQIRQVILPIVAPGLAATALLCVIFAWNEFFLAIQLNPTGASTMPVWVNSQQKFQGQFIAGLSAASVLATLPVVIAGWVAQKRMIRGLAMGAIK